MNRIVYASPTKPSTALLNSLSPINVGCLNPRRYNCVASVEVLTCRSLSRTSALSGVKVVSATIAVSFWVDSDVADVTARGPRWCPAQDLGGGNHMGLLVA